MDAPNSPHGIPDYHGDNWVRTDHEESGELRYNPAEHEAERARDGFSTYDWWNFDQFVAEIIARAALRFAKDGVGYFHEMGEEGTNEYFLGIAGPLMRYAEDKLVGGTGERQIMLEEAQAAMMRFAEHFMRWWD